MATGPPQAPSASKRSRRGQPSATATSTAPASSGRDARGWPAAACRGRTTRRGESNRPCTGLGSCPSPRRCARPGPAWRKGPGKPS
eukprot:305934-Pyramimonas_sp.AAC.1